MRNNKKLFYTLSFTWGIIMTFVGVVAALCLVVTGHKPKKHGWCYYFEVGNGWGGVNLGIVFITASNPSEHTKNHEHGHALQNCLWGPLMPFVVSLPSATRYWKRYFQQKQGVKLEPYDSVWYEGQATAWGTALINSLESDVNGDN
jgi:hypothetical protein